MSLIRTTLLGCLVVAVLAAQGCARPAPAQPEAPPAAQPAVPPTTAQAALDTARLAIPAGWLPVATRHERHDDRPVTVVRYQAEAPARGGGEHVTVVLDEGGTLLGYTRMVAYATGALPDDDQAERQAMEWLRSFDADYAAGLTVSWIDQHDETVTDAAGTERTISGVKVKTHHESGLYAWIIVGADGQIITYERDIRWDSSAGRRGTEMWLHDTWIAAREGGGPQPDAPYAIAS